MFLQACVLCTPHSSCFRYWRVFLFADCVLRFICICFIRPFPCLWPPLCYDNASGRFRRHHCMQCCHLLGTWSCFTYWHPWVVEVWRAVDCTNILLAIFIMSVSCYEYGYRKLCMLLNGIFQNTKTIMCFGVTRFCGFKVNYWWWRNICMPVEKLWRRAKIDINYTQTFDDGL